jgi:hypothetical protein
MELDFIFVAPRRSDIATDTEPLPQNVLPPLSPTASDILTAFKCRYRGRHAFAIRSSALTLIPFDHQTYRAYTKEWCGFKSE